MKQITINTKGDELTIKMQRFAISEAHAQRVSIKARIIVEVTSPSEGMMVSFHYTKAGDLVADVTNTKGS